MDATALLTRRLAHDGPRPPSIEKPLVRVQAVAGDAAGAVLVRGYRRTPMRARLFALFRWALFSVVAGVALLEVVLRIAGYTYSPLALIRLDERRGPGASRNGEPRSARLGRAAHRLRSRASLGLEPPRERRVGRGRHARRAPRGRPRAGAEADRRGGRLRTRWARSTGILGRVPGRPWATQHAGRARRGSLAQVTLQDLIDLNEPEGSWRVVNAGVHDMPPRSRVCAGRARSSAIGPTSCTSASARTMGIPCAGRTRTTRAGPNGWPAGGGCASRRRSCTPGGRPATWALRGRRSRTGSRSPTTGGTSRSSCVSAATPARAPCCSRVRIARVDRSRSRAGPGSALQPGDARRRRARRRRPCRRLRGLPRSAGAVHGRVPLHHARPPADGERPAG